MLYGPVCLHVCFHAFQSLKVKVSHQTGTSLGCETERKANRPSEEELQYLHPELRQTRFSCLACRYHSGLFPRECEEAHKEGDTVQLCNVEEPPKNSELMSGSRYLCGELVLQLLQSKQPIRLLSSPPLWLHWLC